MVLIIVSFYSSFLLLLGDCFSQGLFATHLILNPKILGDLFRSPTALLEYMIILNFMQLVLKIVSKFHVCERKTSEYGAGIPERL